MGPLSAIGTAFAKTFTYKGRASRSEYWWYWALYTLVLVVCAAIDTVMILRLVEEQGQQAAFAFGVFDLTSVYAWIILVPPFISLTIRRLHDAGFSGFWFLLYLVPFGGLALLVMHIWPSSRATTVHGTPAAGPATDPTGKPVTKDAHQRAMQGYALLFDKDKAPSAETKAARKAEISDYYRKQVLKSAPSA